MNIDNEDLGIQYNIKSDDIDIKQADSSNPVKSISAATSINITNYTQEYIRPNYDNDSFEIISDVNSVNNMIPQKLPVYNFNTEEINGDYYHKPDGTLLLIREYDSDVIRDYYVKASDNSKIDRILEYDKSTCRLRTKIEPVSREGSNIKSNITLFDVKINNKYILMQLTQDGTVNNITEFSDNGKNFKTVYRSYDSTQVTKYISGQETKDDGFVMTNCVFDKDGKVTKIKKISDNKEITITYQDGKKSVNVKNKV